MINVISRREKIYIDELKKCDPKEIKIWEFLNKENEVFKKINVEGLCDYYISNFGVIYNEKLTRLGGYKRDTDYVVFKLGSKNGESRVYKCHRLVCLTFNGLPIDSDHDKVDHINWVRYDNRVSNLRWATFSENSKNIKEGTLERNTRKKQIINEYMKSGEQFGKRFVLKKYTDYLPSKEVYKLFYLDNHDDFNNCQSKYDIKCCPETCEKNCRKRFFISNHGYLRDENWDLVHPTVDDNFYLGIYVRPHIYAEIRFVYLHRLVYEHFIADNTIIHINGNVNDNTLDNVKIVRKIDEKFIIKHKDGNINNNDVTNLGIILLRDGEKDERCFDEDEFDVDGNRLKGLIKSNYMNLIKKDEVFKSIDSKVYGINFENYSISNHGRVKNTVKDKLLEPRVSDETYLGIELSYGEKGHRMKKTIPVHRLVCEVFNEGYTIVNNQVNHIDEIRYNNNYTNLEWTSCTINNQLAKNIPVMMLDDDGNVLKDNSNELISFRSLTDANNYLNVEALKNGDRPKLLSDHFANCIDKGVKFRGYKWKYVNQNAREKKKIVKRSVRKNI